MGEIFSKIYYGNTVLQWCIAAGIIIGAFVAGKILYWLTGKTIRRLTAKTKTRIDDIIIDMVEEPAVFAVVVFGIWYAVSTLQMPESTHLFVKKVFYALIVFNVTWFITRIFDALIEEYLVPAVKKSDGNLDDQILPVVRKGVKIALWIIALIVALDNAGYDVVAVLTGLGIGGLALALAAQDTVSNLFGGVTVFVDKPFMVGDKVISNGYEGTVEEIGIRTTKIRIYSGRLVIIPNSGIINKPIENISSEASRRNVISLPLPFETDISQVELAIEILKNVVKNNSHLEEKCVATLDNFGPFSLNLLFTYFIRKEFDVFETRNEVNLEILKRFKQQNLKLALPAQTIYTNEI